METMHLQLFPISCIFFAIVSLISLPASLAQGNEQYLNCSQQFQCGNIQGIGYPFWGANRSQSCGHPSFFLDCTGEAPVLTIQTQPYRVLAIDNATHTLTAVREEFWNNDCPQYLYNATLDTDHFSYAADAEELVLHYGCTALTPGITIPNEFSCLANGTNGTFGVYESSGVTTDVFNTTTSVSCGTSVSVWVNSTEGQSLGNSSSTSPGNLTRVVNSGLGLEWKANNTSCHLCVTSGGVCGSNSSYRSSFVCYCPPDCISVSSGGIKAPDAGVCGPTSSNPPDQFSSSFVCYCPAMSNNRFASCETDSKRNPERVERRLGIVIGSFLVGGALALTTLALFCYLGRNFSVKSFFSRNNEDKIHADLKAILNNCGSIAPKRYSYSEVKRMTNSFKEKLGQGGYGKVYKGKLKNGSLIAVKVLTESKGNGEEFINEVASITRTAHVNVVNLLGFCFEGCKKALIYEFMPNGSLDKFISNKNSSVEHQLGWGTLYQIAIAIARGLEYLQRGCNTRILHLDIKPHNILLDEGFCPKISDFGLAKLCPNKTSIISMHDRRGTVGYIAPEVFSRIYGGVSHKSDVFSYGMIIIYIVGGRKNVDPQADHTTEYFPDWLYRCLEQVEEIGHTGNMNEGEIEISRKMMIVGLWCIHTDPSSRPAMSKVVEMLEGSLASLQIPPRPFLASHQGAEPPRSSSTNNIELCSQIPPRPLLHSHQGACSPYRE